MFLICSIRIQFIIHIQFPEYAEFGSCSYCLVFGRVGGLNSNIMRDQQLLWQNVNNLILSSITA